MLEKAWQMEAEGRKIIHFEIGRTDFDTPAPIEEAAIQAMNAGHVHYTLSMGMLELREAIAQDLDRRLGVVADAESEIMITVGSTGGIMNSLLVLLEPEDEIIVPDPMFLFYQDWGEFLGARTVPLPLSRNNNYQITRADIEACLSPKTKAIIINTPHNPTGSALERSSLEAVAAIACEKDLIVISDEVYERITYEPFRHVSIASLPGMRERTILTNSFSKAFAMDGWRLGYLVAPADIMWELDKAQQHTIINATAFIQKAAVTALERGDELIQPMLEEYTARRSLIMEIIEAAPQLSCAWPQGAFYVWIQIKGSKLSGWDLADRLLDEAGVAVVPGEVFSATAQDYLRISYSNTRENIQNGMERLVSTIEKFQ